MCTPQQLVVRLGYSRASLHVLDMPPTVDVVCVNSMQGNVPVQLTSCDDNVKADKQTSLLASRPSAAFTAENTVLLDAMQLACLLLRYQQQSKQAMLALECFNAKCNT